MELLKRTYFFIRFFFVTIGLWVLASGGFDKWKMMKWAMDKDHHEKSISFSVKPIAIPIPLPLPIPVAMKEKGDTKAAKPWKAESKDMFWKMMMMKMVMNKGDKGKGKGDKCCPQMVMMGGWPAMQKGGGDKKGSKASKGSKMCCPQMQMNGGWPKMKSAMKKGAANMMCCPQMMMNGGWSDSGSSGCQMMMMNGGWSPPAASMCCPMSGGAGGGWWPEEEEEEEEPDYYEEEEQMTGWDTMNIPVLSPQLFFEKMRRKGDSVPQSTNNIKYNQDELFNRRETLRYVFRKGARSFNYDFENDFD